MITQRYKSIFFMTMIFVWLGAIQDVYASSVQKSAQVGQNSLAEQLNRIELEKQRLEKQQRELVVQKNNIQQKIAREQEQLLYQEQEEKEWRAQHQEAFARADAVIKKLQQENDFAESERLKAQKNDQEKEFSAQKAHKSVELKKQQAQIAHYQQELDGLKHEHEKNNLDIATKDKQQQEIIDALVAKSLPLRASSDIAMLRNQAAQFKAHITAIKGLKLKEGASFIRSLQTSLETIEQRISYLEKTRFEDFNKRINEIKKNIHTIKRAEDFDRVQAAIEGLQKNIDTSALLSSHQNSLRDRIHSELDLLMQQKKASASAAQTEAVEVAASRSVDQEVPTEPESSAPVLEDKDLQPEPYKQKEVTPSPVEKDAAKPVATGEKKETRVANGFVLNKGGAVFDPVKYNNVLVTADKEGHVTNIIYNNQTIPFFPVPETVSNMREDAPEWLAAEIYVQKIGADGRFRAKVLEQAKAQASSDPNQAKYNKTLVDYLNNALIPILEIKAKK